MRTGWWRRLGWLLGSAVGCSASATTYYLSDCSAGAEPTCIAGSSLNDGLTPSTPKQRWSQLPPRAGGDVILFAKGGAWEDAGMKIFIPSASAATPVVWDSYAPPWGGRAKPILIERRANKSLFSFDDSGRKAADGGYIVRNLDLRGGGVMGGPAGANVGVFLYWRVDGVQVSHNPHRPDGWENHRVALRNSHVHDNLHGSVLGGAADLVIENNTLDRNGSASFLEHDLYLSSVTRGVIRGNRITRTTLDARGKCTGSVIVVHGRVDGLTIEDNRIVQAGGGNPTCFGIEVSGGYLDSRGGESFRGVKVRGNTIVDVGHVGIGMRNCTDCAVERNRIVWTAPGGSAGVSMNVNKPSALDAPGNGLTIAANVIHMQAATARAAGIVLTNDAGGGHAVTSNVVHFGPGTPPTVRCFDMSSLAIADFRTFDHNLCHRPGGVTYSPRHATLGLAREGGFDRHGSAEDPLFESLPTPANDFSMSVRTGSPLARTGVLPVSARAPPAGQ
jgi:hypothetical protein